MSRADTAAAASAARTERDRTSHAPTRNGSPVDARATRNGHLVPNATSVRRDSTRRRSLAVADMVALGAAYACVAVVAPLHAPIETRLALLAALPVWIMLNKLRGLYDR